MWDPSTGGAFDGLERDGANLNQGTESTLALLSTLQHARSSRERRAMTCASTEPGPSQPGPHCGRQSRVVTRLFVPGHEGFDQQESRSSAVLRRVLELSDDEVAAKL